METNQTPQTPPQFNVPAPKKKPGCLKIGLIIFGLCMVISIICALFATDDEKNQPQAQEQTVQPLTKEEWSAALIEKLESDSEILDSIKSQYKSINNATDLQLYRLTLENMAAKKISDSTYMDVYDNPEVVALMDKNSQRAKKLLPELMKHTRAVYAKQLADKLWENNIEVETSNGGTTITFIGGVFANNRNIKQWQEEVGDGLREMGFKRVEYKWIPSAREFTYYDLTK